MPTRLLNGHIAYVLEVGRHDTLVGQANAGTDPFAGQEVVPRIGDGVRCQEQCDDEYKSHEARCSFGGDVPDDDRQRHQKHPTPSAATIRFVDGVVRSQTCSSCASVIHVGELGVGSSRLIVFPGPVDNYGDPNEAIYDLIVYLTRKVMNEDLSGENRCWPCTIANSTVGLVVGWLPLAVALVRGSPELVAGTVVWGVLVTCYTGYRLVTLGYLPGSQRMAKRLSLHERIGPGSKSESDAGREND